MSKLVYDYTTGLQVRQATTAYRRETFSTKDVENSSALAGILTRLTSGLFEVNRQLPAPTVEYQNIVITAAPTRVALGHTFPAAVRWYLVDAVVTAAPNVSRDTTNTVTGTLVLTFGTTGTYAVRVEPA